MSEGVLHSARAQATKGVDVESTADLLAKVREGDDLAREQLVQRYLPILRTWATGRLPGWARDLNDTDDLVQNTLVRALSKVKEFEPRREGAFLSYLRRILLNQIRDQIRHTSRRPGVEEMDAEAADQRPSPLEEAIGKEALEGFEAALARLPEKQHEAIVLKIEMQFNHQQVADALGCPTANSARMLVTRALARLAEVMDER
jgi:RNA polymerase sigma-70 factor (ECF subfamily)